jgi:hypothetical protein
VGEKLKSRFRQSGIVQNSSVDISKIDNRNGSSNIRGIYRWINKIYKTYLFNCGRRLIVEFGISDPAKSFRQTDGLFNIPAPPKSLPPSFNYYDITRSNYLQYASDYGMDDYPLPPDETRKVSVVLRNQPEVTEAELIAPEGYSSSKAVVQYIINGTELMGMIGDCYFNNSTDPITPSSSGASGAEAFFLSGASPQVHFASEQNASSSSGYYYPSMFPNQMSKGTREVVLLNYQGTIPVSVMCNCNFYMVNIEITFVCQASVFKAWQIRFCQLVVRQYEKLRKEYFDRTNLRELWKLQRKVERNELKKDCLKQIEAVGNSELADRSMPYSFFERAFEWDKMTYSFFSRCIKTGAGHDWTDIHQELYTDPEFNRFIAAKSAKVVVAVKRGYELDVINLVYNKTGSSSESSLTSARYRDFVQELQSIDDRHRRIGEPWTITVPTEMVILQDDPELPEFQNPL